MKVPVGKIVNSTNAVGRAIRLGLGIGSKRLRHRSVRAMHESEVRDGLEKWGNVLLYGSGYGAQMLMKRLTEGSDDITAIVNSEELQCRHRQIAMDRLGEATYENIKRLGFVPDLIVARCRDLSEASGLLAWTKLGSRLICMVQPDWFGHRSWGIVDGFDIQAFCSGDGAAIVAEAPTSLQLSLS